MERYFKVIDARTAASDTRWDQPWGEWKTIRDNHTELTVRLREAKDLEREMDVVFRIFDDGVGFRYVLPEQPNLQTAHIADELTEFAVRSEEHTSELQSLMRISYAVFCLKKKKTSTNQNSTH